MISEKKIGRFLIPMHTPMTLDRRAIYKISVNGGNIKIMNSGMHLDFLIRGMMHLKHALECYLFIKIE